MRYDLISDLHDCANRLEQSLGELREMIMAQPLLIARVFSLPPIEKGHEHDAVTEIAVEQHLGEAAREMALAHFCRLFMQHQSEKLSTKAAVRLPGALCIEAEGERETALIDPVSYTHLTLPTILRV